MRNTLSFAALGAAALGFGNPAHAQLSDQPYPGTIALQVDLTDAARKIFRVSETIPVQAGKLDLSYPKWIPGEHSPSGPIEGVTGLTLSAGGKRLPWRRDLVDMYTIHVDVPAGVSSLELAFQFLSPTGGGAFGTSVSATSKIVDLEWNQVLFYPGNHRASDVRVEPSVRLSSGWSFASALETVSEDNGGAHFKPVSVETLVDSPLIAGRNFKRIDLAPGAKVPVHLDIVADHAENLALSDAQLAAARNLVTQAQALFGAQHYDHYDFLFTLSESTGHFGLEHHQSSDDRQFARYFTDAETYLAGSGLLPHEYVHSWNGKFRRPAGLATPNLNVPMQDDLLWVYEGLTQYYGEVLAARCNMRSAEQYRDNFALFAGVI
jgi:predicted metalloprotease with PDZ domain